MPRLMVVAEIREARPTRLTFELLGMAQQLLGGGGQGLTAETDSVAVVAFGPDVTGCIADLIACGADQVFTVDDPQLDDFDSDRWADALTGIASVNKPELILLGHTSSGCDVAPRLAFRLGGAVVTGCSAIALDAGTFLFTRACYGGNLLETLYFEAGLTVATQRSGSGPAPIRDASRRGCVIPWVPPAPGRTKVMARQRDAGETLRLEDARVVIAGGRGINGAQGFTELQTLAAPLGAAVGASRVACDLDWCPKSWQIGLTGKSVSPELYIAIGISGASHHMAGCSRAKNIVAINQDPQAPIFRYARYGLVGDCAELVDALSQALGVGGDAR
ncbi:MAG: electron transfer flavoprotein subunit alpha/FixB family protein [Oxalobacteraceae bacterium]|nr:electron transfer flavoprotein subunit alpha/FixB family protein [Oxalobacteraceae bacterium]